MSNVPGVEFAWRVHVAQEQWIARVDVKATVVLTVEGAVLAAVVAALGKKDAFAASIVGWRLVVTLLGAAASAAAVLTALLVVMPQLGRRGADGGSHFLYFGHLHGWDADRLAERLGTLTEEQEITQLAAQLTSLGRVNRRKYLLLRGAVVATLIGTSLLVTAFLWPQW